MNNWYIPEWLEKEVLDRDKACVYFGVKFARIFTKTLPERPALRRLEWHDAEGGGDRLRRIVKRRLKYAGGSRPDMAQGCLERLDPAFLAYIWRYPTAHRPGILEKLRQHSTE